MASSSSCHLRNLLNPFVCELFQKRRLVDMPHEVAPETASSSSGSAVKDAAAGATTPAGAGPSGSAAGSSPKPGQAAATTASGSGPAKQRKTVTFRNVLETSDDKSVIKRFYNPDNRIPLVSIMKKDSLNRPLNYSRGGECIVRPSILSKILNKSSNIDKLNSLKFRSAPSSSDSPNVFGLSRAFGAPMDEDKEESGGVTFRRNGSPSGQKNDDDDEMDEDEDEEENNQDEEDNDQEDIDEGVSEKSGEADKNGGESEERDSEEKQLVMDSHFVLPKRSTRSSRIIKPNKRLIEDGAISKKSAPSSSDSKSKSLFGAPAPSTSSTSAGFSSFGSLKLNSNTCGSGSGGGSGSFVLRQPRLRFQTDSKPVPFGSAAATKSSCPTSPSAIQTPASSLAMTSFGTLASSSSSPNPNPAAGE